MEYSTANDRIIFRIVYAGLLELTSVFGALSLISGCILKAPARILASDNLIYLDAASAVALGTVIAYAIMTITFAKDRLFPPSADSIRRYVIALCLCCVLFSGSAGIFTEKAIRKTAAYNEIFEGEPGRTAYARITLSDGSEFSAWNSYGIDNDKAIHELCRAPEAVIRDFRDHDWRLEILPDYFAEQLYKPHDFVGVQRYCMSPRTHTAVVAGADQILQALGIYFAENMLDDEITALLFELEPIDGKYSAAENFATHFTVWYEGDDHRDSYKALIENAPAHCRLFEYLDKTGFKDLSVKTLRQIVLRRLT